MQTRYNSVNGDDRSLLPSQCPYKHVWSIVLAGQLTFGNRVECCFVLFGLRLANCVIVSVPKHTHQLALEVPRRSCVTSSGSLAVNTK